MPRTPATPRLNKRDPWSSRTMEDEAAKESRAILRRAINTATAKIVSDGITDPVQMDDVLKENLDGRAGTALLERQMKGMGTAAAKSTAKAGGIVSRMGYRLGPTGLKPATAKNLVNNVELDVQSVTLDTRKEMARVISSGLSSGYGPNEIARQVHQATDLQLYRCEMIARTTINKTLNETAMDIYDSAGVDGYVIYVTDDDKLCTRCLHEAMENGTFRVYKLRPQVPIHPNCRCAVLPHFPGQKDLSFEAYQPSALQRAAYYLDLKHEESDTA